MVGQHCAVRVQLYHALWHYKHNLRAKLKKALKQAHAALRVRPSLSPHAQHCIVLAGLGAKIPEIGSSGLRLILLVYGAHAVLAE